MNSSQNFWFPTNESNLRKFTWIFSETHTSFFDNTCIWQHKHMNWAANTVWLIWASSNRFLTNNDLNTCLPSLWLPPHSVSLSLSLARAKSLAYTRAFVHSPIILNFAPSQSLSQRPGSTCDPAVLSQTDSRLHALGLEFQYTACVCVFVCVCLCVRVCMFV